MAKRESIKKADVLNHVETMPVAGEKPVADATGTSRTTKVTIGGITVDVPLGRPVDPESERQRKLAAQEERKAANGGTAKLGRPAVPGSPNQLKKAALEARKADPNYKPQRGRPAVEGSKRQHDLAEKDRRLKERALQVMKDQGLVPADATLETLEAMETEHATA